MSTLSAAWQTFEDTARAASREARSEVKRGRALADAFRAQGVLRMTPTRALAESDLSMVTFYRALASDGPRLRAARDPSWMSDVDFAFVNIRACGRRRRGTGRITDAMKIVPTMRVSAIHLAPFFDHTLNNLYAVDSVSVVSDDVLDASLTAAGVDGPTQIRLLVDAIHTLGWRVGFDLEPHTSNFSRLALAHPDCFRWLRLSAHRDGLWGGVSEEKMLSPPAQKRLVTEVERIVRHGVRAHGLSAVEDMSCGIDAVRACHAALTQTLIAEGYWTLPSHTWNGVGLPRFARYVQSANHPDYVYLDAAGKEQHKHAFGMLSPFKLFDGLPVNAAPTPDDPPTPVPAAIDLLNGIFPRVQAECGFDFVRLDYVDHIFDSTVAGTRDVPVSDRLTPELLKELLAAARRQRPHTGAMAERMGVDVERYGALGFDLVLGTDVLSPMHAEYVRFILDLQRRLLQPSEARCSVLATLDTHDSGHPLFWSKPLSEVVGANGMHLRHFIARFGTCGRRRRPKYEVMGNQDMSSGLYAANNHRVSLNWKDDGAFNRRYHALEDVYARWRAFLDAAQLGPCMVSAPHRWAAWFLDGDDERLLCVVALEPAVGKLAQWARRPPRLLGATQIVVDVAVQTGWSSPLVHEIPLNGRASRPKALDGTRLVLKRLGPQRCRLYHVRRGE